MHIHRFLRLSYLGNLSIISDLLLVHPLRFSITYLTLLCSAPMGDSQPAHNCGMWGQTNPGPDAVWSYVYPMGSVSISWLRWTHGCVLGGGSPLSPKHRLPIIISFADYSCFFFIRAPLREKESVSHVSYHGVAYGKKNLCLNNSLVCFDLHNMHAARWGEEEGGWGSKRLSGTVPDTFPSIERV